MTTTVLDSLTRMHEAPRYPRKIRLSEQADAVIAGYAVDLVMDRLQYSQLPESFQAFYTFAFEAGRTSGLESREGIDRALYERDLYYFCWVNRKTPADYRNAQTDELWAEASR